MSDTATTKQRKKGKKKHARGMARRSDALLAVLGLSPLPADSPRRAVKATRWQVEELKQYGYDGQGMPRDHAVKLIGLCKKKAKQSMVDARRATGRVAG